MILLVLTSGKHLVLEMLIPVWSCSWLECNLSGDDAFHLVLARLIYWMVCEVLGCLSAQGCWKWQILGASVLGFLIAAWSPCTTSVPPFWPLVTLHGDTISEASGSSSTCPLVGAYTFMVYWLCMVFVFWQLQWSVQYRTKHIIGASQTQISNLNLTISTVY